MLKYLPIPLSRYSIFTGTNKFSEAMIALKSLLTQNFEDQKIIQKYETAFAQAAGCQHGFSFASGRMGLYTIIKALDLQAGDEVILPAFTCVVVPNALLYAGVKPVYIDIKESDFNLDPQQIEAKITDKTKVLYAQHTFGNLCDMQALRELANKYHLTIVEDCAHAFGNKLNGQLAGALGDVSFFSTDHSKVINTGLGGMVCTNDERIAKKLTEQMAKIPFPPRPIAKKLSMMFFIEYFIYLPWLYWLGRYLFYFLSKMKFFSIFPNEMQVQYSEVRNYPVRLTSPLAEIGIQQLQHLQENLSHRQGVAKELAELIPTRPFDKDSTYLRFSFLVKDRSLFTAFHQTRFDLGIWFDSIFQGRHDQFEKVAYTQGSCPVAEKCAEHIVNYPTHDKISVGFVKKKLKDFFKEHPDQLI